MSLVVSPTSFAASEPMVCDSSSCNHSIIQKGQPFFCVKDLRKDKERMSTHNPAELQVRRGPNPDEIARRSVQAHRTGASNPAGVRVASMPTYSGSGGGPRINIRAASGGPPLSFQEPPTIGSARPPSSGSLRPPSSGPSSGALLRADGYTPDHTRYFAEEACFRSAAYAAGGHTIQLKLAVAYKVLGSSKTEYLSGLQYTSPMFNATKAIPDIVADIRHQVQLLTPEPVRLLDAYGPGIFNFVWNASQLLVFDVTNSSAKDLNASIYAGIDLVKYASWMDTYSDANPYIIANHGSWSGSGGGVGRKKGGATVGDGRWKASTKGMSVRVIVVASEMERFEEHCKTERELAEKRERAANERRVSDFDDYDTDRPSNQECEFVADDFPEDNTASASFPAGPNNNWSARTEASSSLGPAITIHTQTHAFARRPTSVLTHTVSTANLVAAVAPKRSQLSTVNVSTSADTLCLYTRVEPPRFCDF
ncbi:hypothetical protein CYLTODRAFT_459175 [Cylindrobasidium torrendii FP15055 ss-10]|uniref:Uncharacterized protein n=1 Tax=Cylindrobasidium torrendii FP15055 ss-10 TaxID=1314674 RepID=A0A0D7AY83_9AGAR|nr:hypothetical protein CYLTODRAFT_459175 [Cylindrobasidium torrendii FP15055 ss-10]